MRQLVLLFLTVTVATVACTDATAPRTATSTAAPSTPSPLLTATLDTTPTNTPIAIPEPGSTPAPIAIPEPRPTPSLTATPAPTPTPEPTPTPDPTPTPPWEQLAEAQLSQIIPWFADPPDDLHKDVAEQIIDLWVNDPDLGERVARLPWVLDGLTQAEELQGQLLGDLVPEEPDYALWVLMIPWVMGMATDGPGYPNVHEWPTFNLLLKTVLTQPALAPALEAVSGLTDSVSQEEYDLVLYLATEFAGDPELAYQLVQLDWVADGLDPTDRLILDGLASVGADVRSFPGYTQDIFQLSNSLPGDLGRQLWRSLVSITQHPDLMEQIAAQPWYVDGLDEEESALLLVLHEEGSQSKVLFNELLGSHFVQRKGISLPLAGDVRIWVIQPKPFPPDDDVLTTIEDSVRISEEFMGVPFPEADIILLIVEDRHWFEAAHYGNFMALTRNEDGEVANIPRQTAHYFFRSGPRWYSDGGAAFMESYVFEGTGVRTLESRWLELIEGHWCQNFANIRHWTYLVEMFGWFAGDSCPYRMGENFLLNLWILIGYEGMAEAFREVYQQGAISNDTAGDELIFDAFQRNVPEADMEEFRDLYTRFHSGAFVFPETDFSDEHGDDLTSASALKEGETIQGNLDYLFDFDFFQFRAEEGGKYYIELVHAALPDTALTLWGPDERELPVWRSRRSEETGPRIIWVPEASGEFYVAVQNFAGDEGPYTLKVTRVPPAGDDHGDSFNEATKLSAIHSTEAQIDDYFDVDYFSFQGVAGQSYLILAEVLTLDGMNLMAYHPSQQAPKGRWIFVSPGKFVGGITTAWTGEWLATRNGTYYLAVKGHGEFVGTYTISVTPVSHN